MNVNSDTSLNPQPFDNTRRAPNIIMSKGDRTLWPPRPHDKMSRLGNEPEARALLTISFHIGKVTMKWSANLS